MKKILAKFIAISLAILIIFTGRAPVPTQPDEQASVPDPAVSNFSDIPISFIPNRGQTDESIAFQAKGLNQTLFFTKNKVVFGINTASASELSSFNLVIDGVSSITELTGGDELQGKVNYFIGNDPDKWYTNIPSYESITYEDIYKGINLTFSGSNTSLKGTYEVSPGADPSQIRWHYNGVDNVTMDEETGDLVITIKSGDEAITLRENAPVAWQEIDGEKKEVEIGYDLSSEVGIRFILSDYDANHLLVIDPVIVFSTYLGGSGTLGDQAWAIDVDDNANVYITGNTFAPDFPVTPGSSQTTLVNRREAFVTKFSSDGSSLVYSTFLGGGEDDQGEDIAVDASGHAYITGYTTSTNYPVTAGALRTVKTNAGQINNDAFVTKLSPAGDSLVYSTYLGADPTREEAYGIDIDSQGNAYVTGWTVFIPTTPGAFQTNNAGSSDAFVSKLNATGSALIYSTYLGGSGAGGDYGQEIAVDSSGSAYVTGVTESDDFPVLNAVQSNRAGGRDVFVTKFTPDGSALEFSTYLGGSLNDESKDLDIDTSGNIYVVGEVESSDFPTASALQSQLGGHEDAFVSKMSAVGGLMYSTYLGGSIGGVVVGSDVGLGIVSDDMGNAYIVGNANSDDFPLADPIQSSKGSSTTQGDAFVAKISSDGSSLLFSTYVGGTGSDTGNDIAVDQLANIYITGSTSSFNFPITPGAFQTTKASGGDAFVLKINPFVFNNTPIGSNVTVNSGDVTFTFSQVNSAGNTIVATTTTGTTPPTGFKLGNPSIYYSIQTTAVFSGTVELCINYDEVTIQGNEANLKLMHFEVGIGWVNVTSSLDTTNNIICGVVTSFSEFAVMTQPIIQDLIDRVEQMNLQQGIENSLDAKLQRAQEASDAQINNSLIEAINVLDAFISEVEAQRGNKITPAQADELHLFADNLKKIINGDKQF